MSICVCVCVCVCLVLFFIIYPINQLTTKLAREPCLNAVNICDFFRVYLKENLQSRDLITLFINSFQIKLNLILNSFNDML